MPNTVATFNIMKTYRYEKYWFVRGYGLNSSHASKMRDWRWTKLYRYFGLPLPNGLEY